jgi:hypothetical protein
MSLRDYRFQLGERETAHARVCRVIARADHILAVSDHEFGITPQRARANAGQRHQTVSCRLVFD